MQMNLSVRRKQNHGHGDRRVIVKGEERVRGMEWSLGLTEANWRISNG